LLAHPAVCGESRGSCAGKKVRDKSLGRCITDGGVGGGDIRRIQDSTGEKLEEGGICGKGFNIVLGNCKTEPIWGVRFPASPGISIKKNK